MSLTEAEKLTNYETLKHIRLVQRVLNIVVSNLLTRSDLHDQSKLEQPEVEGFAKAGPLHSLTYGSEEYKNNCKLIEDTLNHHYARNPHHPQYYKNGVNDMTLIDVVEMLCDWKASSLRHHDGNICKSIEINASRYGISKQLAKILENTSVLFDQIREETE